MTLADRIAVFMDGRIVQVGTPREIFATPQTLAVAGFIGTPPMNLLPATWSGASVEIGGATLPVRARVAAAPRPVTLGVRPATCASSPATTAWRRRSSGSRTSATAGS